VQSEAPAISSIAAPAPARARKARAGGRVTTGLSLGVISTFLLVIVVLPLAALLWESKKSGTHGFWQIVSSQESVAALKLTFGAAFIVALLNAVLGTITAWVLVRDDFRGKTLVNAIIDLPFALPTIVAGLVLLELYGADSPLGVNLAYTRVGVAVALLFVTLPFVVRTVQPVLLELDRDMEQAAASLGAGNLTIFRRIILPNLLPAMVSGTALAFTRSIAEFGSTVLISGNLPFKTQVAAVQIFGQIENDNTASAAAVSTALLVVAFVVLVSLDLVQRWGSRRG
jgi:sulfate transport system permease protein